MSSESVRFEGHGGDAVSGELTLGSSGAGVVVVHEVFGLDAFTRGVCEQLNAAGYATLAPDLYSREGLPGPPSTPADPGPTWTPDQIRAAAQSLPDRRCARDLDAAAACLVERASVDRERVAVLGFCRGGTLAFLAGCQSRRFSAVVACYGRMVYPELGPAQPVQPLEMALGLDAPLLAIFGDQDPSIPPEHVDLLQRRLSAFARTAEVEVYPGAKHGFLNPLRPAYHPEHALRAWERMLAFLAETLPA